MKPFVLLIMILGIILSAFGCTAAPSGQTSPTNAATTAEPTTHPTQTEETPQITIQQLPMTAISLPVITDAQAAEDGTVVFCQTYQNISLTLPDATVADKIILDFLNRTDIHKQAQLTKEEAIEMYNSGVTPLPLWEKILYAPQRIDQSVISLYGNHATYTGGAHGSFSCKAVTYDLLTGDPLTLGNIVTDDTSADLICQLICDALEPDRQELYLFEDYRDTVENLLSGNIRGYADWYLSNIGLCFFFSPYEIGPYASGDIVAEIPYNRLTGILRDAYFPAENETVAGSVVIEPFDKADLSRYNQIAEVTLDDGGKRYVIHTDTKVDNIRIIQEAPYFADPSMMDSYTVFGAGYLTPGDAIVLQIPEAGNVRITYTTADGEFTQTIEN